MAFHLFTYVELLVFLSVLLLCVLCQSFAFHDSQFVTQFDSGSFLGRIPFLCGHNFRVCLQHRSIMDLCLLCLHLFMESHCVLYLSLAVLNLILLILCTKLNFGCFVFVWLLCVFLCLFCLTFCVSAVVVLFTVASFGHLLVTCWLFMSSCVALYHFMTVLFFNWIFVTVHWGLLWDSVMFCR